VWRLKFVLVGEKNAQNKGEQKSTVLLIDETAAGILGLIQLFKSESNDKRAYSFVKFVVELFKSSKAVSALLTTALVLTLSRP
jgi:hypothetical protein